MRVYFVSKHGYHVSLGLFHRCASLVGLLETLIRNQRGSDSIPSKDKLLYDEHRNLYIQVNYKHYSID